MKIMTQLTLTDDKYKVFKVVDTQYANDDDAKSYDVAVFRRLTKEPSCRGSRDTASRPCLPAPRSC